jgi:hypothetical protein
MRSSSRSLALQLVLTLRQRLGMQRHLRLCFGLRLSWQAEGFAGIVELMDPGAGGCMENG